MAELVDARDLKSPGAKLRAGSIPAPGSPTRRLIMGHSVRYYCEKCKGYTWMKIDGTIDSEKLNVKCSVCKTAYPNVKIESGLGERSES